jgi:hypothetical protein
MLLLLLLLRLLAQSPPPCETHQPRSIAITWILPPDLGRMFRMKLATLLVFLAVATVSGDDSFGDDSFSRTGGTGQRAFMERLGRCGKRGYLVGFSDGIMWSAPYFGSVVFRWIRSLLFSTQTYSNSSQPGRK